MKPTVIAASIQALTPAIERVSDDELLRRLDELVSHSRRVEVDVVTHIGEVERRQLYAREATPSMFVYCRERLHLSEAEAYMRIRVARAARRHPGLLDMLRDGRLHLSGIVRLLRVLTLDNRDALLARAPASQNRPALVECSPNGETDTRLATGPWVGRLQPRGLESEGQLCPDTVLAASAPANAASSAPTTFSAEPSGSAGASSSHSLQAATRSSSPRARSCATSSSGFKP